MKMKFRAFSVSLVIALIVLLGPRHPEGAFQFHLEDRFSRATDSAAGVARRQAMASMTATQFRLRGLSPGNCGEELMIEDQLNCVIYLLNHPGLWWR